MTDGEWLACTNPTPMLAVLGGRGSERKWRLFGCGCCRLAWALLTDPRSRRAVELAEQGADDPVPEATLRAACRAAHPPRVVADERAAAAADAAHCLVNRWEGQTGRWVAEQALYRLRDAEVPTAVSWADHFGSQHPAQAALVRCVFGNPFRPSPALDPVCLTLAVAALARRVYDDRDFGVLPILADALEEAGCGDPELLGHLRGPGPHARGCWVLELLLTKG